MSTMREITYDPPMTAVKEIEKIYGNAGDCLWKYNGLWKVQDRINVYCSCKMNSLPLWVEAEDSIPVEIDHKVVTMEIITDKYGKFIYGPHEHIVAVGMCELCSTFYWCEIVY